MNKKCYFLFLIILFASILNFQISVIHSQESSPPVVLTELGQIDTIGQANDVIVKGNIAFVSDMGQTTDTRGGLYIFNVSDPSHPVELSHFYDGGRSHQLEFYNDSILLVADNTGGIEIFDVRNLSMPIKIGNFIGANYINGLVIRNSTILATSFSDGLIVVDISNLSHPIEQSRFSLNHIQPITLYNDFALISGLDYFYVLDISNLSNISELKKYDYEISNFKIISSIAYVACSGSILEEAQGFKILDITDLKDIRELGSFDDGGHPIDLIIKDNYAFIANFDHGVDVLDITSRSNIFKITNYFDGGNAHGLEIVNDLLYVADGVDGLEILKIDSTNNNANTAKTVSEAQTAPSFSIILLLGTLVLLTRNKKITQ